MLVLKLKSQERFFIGERVVVTFLDYSRGRVRIGIDAPKHIAVDREDVRNAIAANGGVRRSELPPSPVGVLRKVAVWIKGAIEAAKATGDDNRTVLESMLAEANEAIKAEMEAAV